MISLGLISVHKANCELCGVRTVPTVADAERFCEIQAKLTPGYVYIVWEDGLPKSSCSFPVEEVTV